MNALSILSIFAAHVEQSDQEFKAPDIISQFLAAFFRGDRSIFPDASIDGVKLNDHVIGVWWPSPPAQICPTYQFYGQNRMGMFGRLKTYQALPSNIDWTFLQRSGKEPADIFAQLAETLQSTPPSVDLLVYANHIAFKSITGVRFLKAIGLTTPPSWLEEMGIRVHEIGKAGRKEGLEKQAWAYSNALDELIALGLYQPNPRGKSGAARLIKLLYGSPLTEKGIADNITAHHDQILRRRNHLK